jgi:penicillin amidase
MLKSILKWVLGIALTLVLAVVAVGGFAAYRFTSASPVLEGEARLAGADGPITIVRDRHGVPHIFASTEADLYRGLGYAHAQDRFFQMDATRRAMQGRLSELVGEATLALDARARTMGWSAVAQAQLDALSPEARAVIVAYAQGVNAQLAAEPAPPEYAIFFATPEPWTPVDSLAVSLAMTDTLTGGEYIERARARLAGVLDEGQLAEFLGEYPDFAPTSYAGGDLARALASTAMDTTSPGSNAWVVAGARTASGRPLLANDPHLPLAAPGPFYLARLQGPDGPLIGASLPGAPNIVIGRTNNLAWGTTTHAIDAADDVLLTPDMAVAETSETIQFRRFLVLEGSRTIIVRRTADGPVLDREWFDLEGLYEGRDVVLRTIADDPDNGVAEAVYQAAKATTVEGYFAALAPWTAPPQNLVVADAVGNIGLISPGRFPARDAEGRWIGAIPERLFSANPDTGFFATANNLQTPRDFTYPMPGGHDPYRVTRIADVLSTDIAATADSMAALQLDQRSLLAVRLRPAIASAAPQSDAGRAMQTRLAAWDGVASVASVEATLFAYWVRAMGEKLYADEVGAENYPRFQGPRDVFLDGVLTGALSPQWCDNVTTQESETCAQTVGSALDAASEALIAERGADESGWAWGMAHSARFAHPLLANLPLIGDRFVAFAPFGGNSTTVNVARNWHSRADYHTVHAAGLRMIIDFADLNGSRFMVTPGQSGNPNSTHYTDLASAWAEGEYFEIRDDWSPDNPPQGARILRLAP